MPLQHPPEGRQSPFAEGPRGRVPDNRVRLGTDRGSRALRARRQSESIAGRRCTRRTDDAGLIYGQPTRHAKFFADIYWAKFARVICGMLYCLPDQFIQLSWVLTPHLRGRQNVTASLHQRTAAEAQVSPPPKAVRMSTSPRASRPCSNASCSAIGIVAAVVLP
jgi:hypothetical protein